jgi:hypothetical protein
VATFTSRLKLHQERKRIADLISGNDDLDISQIVACLLLPNAGKDSHMTISTDQNVLKRQLAPLVDIVAKRVAKLDKVNLQRDRDDDKGAGSKPPDAPETETVSKFAMPGRLIQAHFGSQMLFRRGLAALIGLPSVNVRKAMEDEHNNEEPFRPPNYGTTTCPKLEWEFVVRANPGKMYPGEKSTTNPHGRERKPLDELLQLSECLNCNLTEDELIAIRLYTGPMYAKYNEITRAALQQYMTEELLQVLENWVGEPCRHLRDKASCEECHATRKDARVGLISDDQLVEYATRFFGFRAGRCATDAVRHLEQVLEERGVARRDAKRQLVASFSFVTTIHMVSSAIIKLSGQTPMPADRTLYRGLSGLVLPSCFFLASKQGCRSGVEGAFMSCSTNKNVALQYAGKGMRATIFEIAVGEIDIGADVKNLSQVCLSMLTTVVI